MKKTSQGINEKLNQRIEKLKMIRYYGNVKLKGHF